MSCQELVQPPETSASIFPIFIFISVRVLSLVRAQNTSEWVGFEEYEPLPDWVVLIGLTCMFNKASLSFGTIRHSQSYIR